MKKWGDDRHPLHKRLEEVRMANGVDDLPEDFKKAWDDFTSQPDLLLTVPALDLFAVIAAVQLAVRHPQFSPVLKKKLRERLYVWERQAGLVTPSIFRWLEKGWDLRYDVVEPVGKATEQGDK